MFEITLPLESTPDYFTDWLTGHTGTLSRHYFAYKEHNLKFQAPVRNENILHIYGIQDIPADREMGHMGGAELLGPFLQMALAPLSESRVEAVFTITQPCRASVGYFLLTLQAISERWPEASALIAQYFAGNQDLIDLAEPRPLSKYLPHDVTKAKRPMTMLLKGFKANLTELLQEVSLFLGSYDWPDGYSFSPEYLSLEDVVRISIYRASNAESETVNSRESDTRRIAVFDISRLNNNQTNLELHSEVEPPFSLLMDLAKSARNSETASDKNNGVSIMAGSIWEIPLAWGIVMGLAEDFLDGYTKIIADVSAVSRK